MGWFRKEGNNKALADKVANLEQMLLDPNSWMSGGGLFAMNEQLKAQGEKQRLTWKEMYEELEGVDADIQSYTNNLVTPKYFLFWNLCNYYTNLFQYNTNNVDLNNEIKKMLTIGFFNGKAALYFNPVSDRWQAVAIENINYTRYGTVKGYRINLHFDIENGDLGNYNPDYTITNVEPNRIVYYQTKQHGFSCWVWLREFINTQQQLLNQISVSNLINNKIIGFELSNKDDSKSAIKSFLNPTRFFFYTRKEASLSKMIKFVSEFNDVSISERYLEIYRQTIDIYKDMYGIRNNTDYKKERNVSDEVNATQQWFDVLENELFTQFRLFVQRFNQNIHSKERIEFTNDLITSNK